MAKYHIAIEKPEEIVPRLGKQELHWKKGRSAFELSTAWMSATGIPIRYGPSLIRRPNGVARCSLKGCLTGRGKNSQTDLLAILALADGNGVLAVEGKVDESFGPLVEEWLNRTESAGIEIDVASQASRRSNRGSRLEGLCGTLSIDPHAAGSPLLPAHSPNLCRSLRGEALSLPESNNAGSFIR